MEKANILENQKIKEVILYILSQTGCTSYYNLMKIMFCAERRNLTMWGDPITNLEYYARKHGPVPLSVYYKIKQNDSIIVHTDLNSDEIVFKKDTNRNAEEIKTIHIGVNYDNFVNDVKVGSEITIENRDIYAKVVKINKKQGIVELKITELFKSKDKFHNFIDKIKYIWHTIILFFKIIR